jgi:iron complex outermembrane recepter protein
VPLEGKRPPETPGWNANAIVAYHMPVQQLGTFTLQAEANAQGRQSFSLTNFPLAEDPARIVANFRLLWKSENGRYNAQAFVTNAFNEDYYNFAFDSGIPRNAGGKVTSIGNEPRLWGVKLGVSF